MAIPAAADWPVDCSADAVTSAPHFDAFGLPALEREVARELDAMAYPARDWVVPRQGPDGAPALDCAIIGAGQYGLAIAAGLQRERVARIGVFDVAPAGREGPWVTFARMDMLRTPKDLAGPELGLPSLGFRAGWEAQRGAAGWAGLFRIPRTSWMEYLVWFRRMLDLKVQNGWRLVALVPAGAGLFRLEFATPEGARLLWARTVVLATGAGSAQAMPDWLRDLADAGRVLHANEPIDFSGWCGARVGVLGAGASAFDAAIVALEAGAQSAAVCFRRGTLPRANPRRWMESAGFLAHYVDLPDAVKWAYSHRLQAIGQPPPLPTFERAMAQPGFALRPGFAWQRATRQADGAVLVEGGGQLAVFDRLIVATGMTPDLAACPELAAIAPHVALWRDRFVPPPGLEAPGLGACPYLDRCGAFTPRRAGDAPWASRLFSVAGGAGLSLGPLATSVSAMKYVAPRVVEGVKRVLFLDQQATDWHDFETLDHSELPAPILAA